MLTLNRTRMTADEFVQRELDKRTRSLASSAAAAKRRNKQALAAQEERAATAKKEQACRACVEIETEIERVEGRMSGLGSILNCSTPAARLTPRQRQHKTWAADLFAALKDEKKALQAEWAHFYAIACPEMEVVG